MTGSKPNSFDVMKAMSARNWNIQLAPVGNITGAQKTKAGTLVTIGVGGDQVAAIADGRFVGGLILADKIQYAAMEKSLAADVTHFTEYLPDGSIRYSDKDGNLLCEHRSMWESVRCSLGRH